MTSFMEFMRREMQGMREREKERKREKEKERKREREKKRKSRWNVHFGGYTGKI